MANGILSQIANPQVANPLGAFVQGEEIGRQRNIRSSLAQLAGAPREQQMAGLRQMAFSAPEQSSKVMEMLQGIDQQNLVSGSYDLLGALAVGGEAQTALLQSARNKFSGNAFAAGQVDKIIALPEEQRNEALVESAQAMQSLGIIPGKKDSASAKSFAPVTLKNPETGEKILATPTFDPATGKAKLEQFDIPAGFEVSKETPEERRAADVIAAQQKEIGKLQAQLGLSPQIAGAVATAKNEAKAAADVAKEERSAEKAWDVYNNSMSNLTQAMAGTETGPVVGFIPAVTANQQIAEGAVAVMAPVLKQMFRAAGEGVFTDRDQALLMEMIPTRRDLPAARAAKIEAIDKVVRAKLGIGTEDGDGRDSGQPNPPTPTGGGIQFMGFE